MLSTVLIQQIIILFLVIAVGYYARKRGILTHELNKGLTELLLNITVPLMIISSYNFHFSKSLLINAGKIFIFSIAAHFLSLLLGKLLFRKYPPDIQKILIFTATFSNCAFMGFPIYDSLYGKIGVFYGSIMVMGFNLFLWTIGTVIFTGKPDWKTVGRALTNPGVTSVFVGMFIFVFSIKLPEPIEQAVHLIGSMTTPLSMIIVGSVLAECKLNELFSGLEIYYGIFIRLIILPAITILVLTVLHFGKTLLGVCALSIAMPAAAVTAIFAEKFDGNRVYASRIVFLSTVLSILTIPMALAMISYIK